jgi:hypothetical protein
LATADERRRALVAIVPPASREDVGARVREWGEGELGARREVLKSGTHRVEGDARAVLDVLTQTTKVENAGTTRKKKKARFMAGAAGALVLGGVLAAAAAMRRAPSPASGSELRAWTSTETATLSATATATATATSSSVTEPRVETSTSTPAPMPRAPVASASLKRPLRDAAAAAAAIDCTVPYVVDADGHRHYRAECFAGKR